MRLDKLIRGLANGDIKHPSWTDAARARLNASITLHSLAAQEPLRQPSPSYDWRLFESFIVAELSGGSRETFMALFLDTHYRLLSAEVLFMGSVDSAPVYTRVVASRALARKQRPWWSRTIIPRVFLSRVILMFRLPRNCQKHGCFSTSGCATI